MGASRTLLRKLDLDLIARIEASGTPDRPAKSNRKRKPRSGSSYRGARRNAVRATGAIMQRSTLAVVRGSPFAGSIALNRSQNRMPAKSYAHAREISPSTEPVR